MLTLDLSGKVALITGVGSGIGKSVAVVLARAGCSVSGCDLSKTGSEAALGFSGAVEAEGSESLYSLCDVSDTTELESFVQKTVDRFGKIDIVVSNAGMNIFKGAQNCMVEDWDFNMDLNLRAHWLLAKHCKPYLEETRGVIIIMTSNHAYYTIPGCFPYNVTKTALKGLVRSLAIEWGPAIRTVGIAPGFIETSANEKWFGNFPEPEKERQRTINMHPVKKLGTPEEVGALCAFLASDMAAFISGTTYLMDGGRSALMQDHCT
ncbi:MAG: SDR family oxidoreductase [Saprospiraceae bacterium]|nr:SDR family oxidoreductase [Lewinella sp.]